MIKALWVLVPFVCGYGAAILTMFAGKASDANSEMKMSFAESVFALNAKFLKDNPKAREWVK